MSALNFICLQRASIIVLVIPVGGVIAIVVVAITGAGFGLLLCLYMTYLEIIKEFRPCFKQFDVRRPIPVTPPVIGRGSGRSDNDKDDNGCGSGNDNNDDGLGSNDQ